jgi:hypothetical protein
MGPYFQDVYDHVLRATEWTGFGQHAGFVTSMVLLVILSGGLYLLFKRLDWP